MKTLILILLALTATAADLTETIKGAEGFSLTMYRDHLGYPTIGWGHRCSADQKPITKEQAEKILAEDIDAAKKNAETLIGKDVPQDVKDIVVEMSFQLGFSGVSKFKGMLNRFINLESRRKRYTVDEIEGLIREAKALVNKFTVAMSDE